MIGLEPFLFILCEKLCLLNLLVQKEELEANTSFRCEGRCTGQGYNIPSDSSLHGRHWLCMISEETTFVTVISFWHILEASQTSNLQPSFALPKNPGILFLQRNPRPRIPTIH